MVFPKLIHQIHFGEKNYILPFQGNIDQIKKINPDYSHKIWNEMEAFELILNRFPQYYNYYKGLSVIEKTDFFRYILMYFFGGIYLDLDVILHKPLDEFFSYSKIYFRNVRGVDKLPEKGTAESFDPFKYDVILNGENYIKNGQTFVNNYCLISRPGHELWKLLLERISLSNAGDVYQKTGFIPLTNTLASFSNVNNILVLPSFYFGWADYLAKERPSWVVASHSTAKNKLPNPDRTSKKVVKGDGFAHKRSETDYAKYSVGIGVTTFSRPVLLKQTLQKIKEHTNIPNVRFLLIDDASNRDAQILNEKYAQEYGFEYILNAENQGVARSKNKCFEKFENCDFIFLFDDDCYPEHEDWYDVYINAYFKTGIEHFCATFTHHSDGSFSWHYLEDTFNINGIAINTFNTGCGVCMFYTKRVLSRVGGMDIAYAKWGYEHVGHSNRIFNSKIGNPKGVIHAPEGVLNYLKMWDYEKKADSQIPRHVKVANCEAKLHLLNEECKSHEFKPYKKQNFIISSYFNGGVDPQRNIHWNSDDYNVIKDWSESIKRLNLTGIIFHDNLSLDFVNRHSNENVKFIKVDYDEKSQPTTYRWTVYNNFIEKYKEYIDNIFFTDLSDVTILRNPFDSYLFNTKKDYIFCGDETINLDCQWMRERTEGFFKTIDGFQVFYNEFSKKTLLNAGVLGGSVELVGKFVYQMHLYMEALKHNQFNTDMPPFNYIAYTKFGDKLIHGAPVNTKFKKYEFSEICWFKHK